MRRHLSIPTLLSWANASLLLSPAFAQSTIRVSVDSAGGQVAGATFPQAISADGRIVTFESAADNLVQGDTNQCVDIFVHDLQTSITSRVSVDSLGTQANGNCSNARLSANGRFISFSSQANNLVLGDTNGFQDAFVHDRQTGRTIRVSVDSLGAQGNERSWPEAISADGRVVALWSFASNLVPGDTNNESDVFIYDVRSAQTVRVSVDTMGLQGNGDSRVPSISADGRYIAFFSQASNLIAGDTNGVGDAFLHDRQTGQTSRVSEDSAGIQGNQETEYPTISADGKFIAFASRATNLVPGDTNGVYDIFVKDQITGQTSRVSLDSSGMAGNASSFNPCISADGRFVAFQSWANNFVTGDLNGVEDNFVFDRQLGLISLVSVDSVGVQGDAASWWPSISADGRYISFSSYAANLVSGDTNGAMDVFVHDRGAIEPSLVKTGTCPGAISLKVNNATANGMIAVIYGPAGVFVKPTMPCQGLVLGVNPPTLGAIVSANGSGTAILNLNAPAGLCGRSVQAIDMAMCSETNTIVL